MAKKENLNKSVSLILLESYREGLMASAGFLKDAAKQLEDPSLDVELKLKLTQGISNLGKDLGKNIESLDKLEEKVIKEEKADIKRKGQVETSRFED